MQRADLKLSVCRIFSEARAPGRDCGVQPSEEGFQAKAHYLEWIRVFGNGHYLAESESLPAAEVALALSAQLVQRIP